MILVLIGYLSFYFDIENFTDRAMVVLTTMLVIATITSSIQAVSFPYYLCDPNFSTKYVLNNHLMTKPSNIAINDNKQ